MTMINLMTQISSTIPEVNGSKEATSFIVLNCRFSFLFITVMIQKRLFQCFEIYVCLSDVSQKSTSK